MAAGRFRADLFYRLNTVEVTLPPLSQRSDFPAIARHLLARIAPGFTVTDAALECLARRPWPGNIRELRSALTRLTLAESCGVIGREAVASLGEPAAPAPVAEPGLRALQRSSILTVFSESGGNVSETARRLRVSRNTVYRALQDQDRTAAE